MPKVAPPAEDVAVGQPKDFGRSQAAELVAQGKDDPDLITCPDCEGRKGGEALVCGPGISEMRWMPCTFCHGSGKVWSYNGTQYRLGRRLRETRMAKDLTIREAAKLYGRPFLEWNDLERGCKAITETDDAAKWLATLPAPPRDTPRPTRPERATNGEVTK